MKLKDRVTLNFKSLYGCVLSLYMEKVFKKYGKLASCIIYIN